MERGVRNGSPFFVQVRSFANATATVAEGVQMFRGLGSLVNLLTALFEVGNSAVLSASTMLMIRFLKAQIRRERRRPMSPLT